MARLSDSEKSLLIADYHTNKYSQRELSKKYGVSVGTVSKLTKEIVPQNEHLVNAQNSITRAKEEISSAEMNAIMNTSADIIRREGLVFGNAEKLAKKLGKMTKKVSEPQDLRHLVEANDKLSITLKVNDRHAAKTEIINTNATQNNTKRVTIARRSDRRND